MGVGWVEGEGERRAREKKRRKRPQSGSRLEVSEVRQHWDTEVATKSNVRRMLPDYSYVDNKTPFRESCAGRTTDDRGEREGEKRA